MQDVKRGDHHKKESITKSESYYKNSLAAANKEMELLSYEQAQIVRELSERIEQVALSCQNNDKKNKELFNELYEKMKHSKELMCDQDVRINQISSMIKAGSMRSDSNAKTLESLHQTTQDLFRMIERMASTTSLNNAINSNTPQPPPPKPASVSIASKVPPTVYAGVIMAAMALVVFLITGNAEVFKILK